MKTILITLAISIPVTAIVTWYIAVRVDRLKAAIRYFRNGSPIG